MYIKEAEMVLFDLSIEVFDICIHFWQVAELVKGRLSTQDSILAIAYNYAYTLNWTKGRLSWLSWRTVSWRY